MLCACSFSKELQTQNYVAKLSLFHLIADDRRESIPVSTLLRKLVRFFIINVFLVLIKVNFHDTNELDRTSSALLHIHYNAEIDFNEIIH